MTPRIVRAEPHRWLDDPAAIAIGRETLDRPVPLHWHGFWELTVVHAGHGRHTVNGERCDLHAGDAVLMSRTDLHELVPEPPGMRVTTVLFSELSLGSEFHDVLPGLAKSLAAHGHRVHLDDPDAFEALRPGCPGDVLTRIDTRTMVERALIGVVRRRGASCAPAAPAGRVNPSSVDLVRTALTWIEDHFRGDVSLGAVARHVGLSANHFSVRFHQVTGRTFQEYRLRRRLDHARAVLRSSTLPVGEVAAASGFHDVAHFSRSYRRAFGVSPSIDRAGTGETLDPVRASKRNQETARNAPQSLVRKEAS